MFPGVKQSPSPSPPITPTWAGMQMKTGHHRCSCESCLGRTCSHRAWYGTWEVFRSCSSRPAQTAACAVAKLLVPGTWLGRRACVPMCLNCCPTGRREHPCTGPSPVNSYRWPTETSIVPSNISSTHRLPLHTTHTPQTPALHSPRRPHTAYEAGRETWFVHQGAHTERGREVPRYCSTEGR